MQCGYVAQLEVDNQRIFCEGNFEVKKDVKGKGYVSVISALSSTHISHNYHLNCTAHRICIDKFSTEDSRSRKTPNRFKFYPFLEKSLHLKANGVNVP